VFEVDGVLCRGCGPPDDLAVAFDADRIGEEVTAPG
jgi:hypothetical protein